VASGLLNKGNILAGEIADTVEVAFGDGAWLDKLAAQAKTARA
jgi:hypothetical protein